MKRNFAKIAAAVMAGAMALSLAACGGSSSSSGSSSAETKAAAETEGGSGEVFKIGGIGPTTGAAAIYGTACKNAAEIAVEEINALGGVQFELNFQDDEHDAEKSVNAYNKLKDWGMQILVGTTTTTPCVAVSTESNADRIFEITPSASSTDVIGGVADADGNVNIPRKDNVFQMCFTDPNQGIASAQYISENQLGSKIAIIYNNSDAYSTGIYNKFVAEAADRNLEIVYTGTFTDDNATDFSVQLGDAHNSGADLLFLPIYYTPASQILVQAEAKGYEFKYFGVDGMDGILTLEGFDTSLAEGVMLLTPFAADAQDDLTKNFVAKYQEKFGADQVPNQFAADTYDCIYAIYNAIQAKGLTPDMSNEELCSALIETFTSSDFSYSGLTGENMTWSESGEVSKDPKANVIQDGAYVGM